jgi:hypothetical protein
MHVLAKIPIPVSPYWWEARERAGGESFRLFPKSRIVMLYDLTLTAEQVAALRAQLAARARRKAIFQIWPIGLLRFLFWRVE